MKTTDSTNRGDQTREALVEAALDIFGQTGFDAASTRAIAASAGANQALIGYHFGGKRGLYLAVFEHILAQVQQHMEPEIATVMARIDHLPEDESQRRQESVQLMELMFNALIEMFGQQASARWVRLIVREQQDPTEAFQILYEGMMGRMLALATHLVAMASGLEENSEACRVRTLMLLGQVLVFHIARGTTSMHLSWSGLTPANVTALKEQFRLSLESQFSPTAVFQ